MEVKTITQQTIGRLLAVVQEAIDCGLSLEQADLILIGELIETVDYLQAQLASQGITIKKLQKLLGMIPSSEKGPSPCEAGKTKPNQSANSTSGNRDGEAPDEAANEAEDPADAQAESTDSAPTKRPSPTDGVIQTITAKYHHPAQLQTGQACPLCPPGYGKVYPHGGNKPRVLRRISAHEPLEATQHTFEVMRCNTCHAVFLPPVPPELTQDGPITQKYGYSAQVFLILDKFLSGTPYFHQSFRHALNNMRLAPSSIYDQIAQAAEPLAHVEQAIRQATAQADLFLYDDTAHQILEQEPEWRETPNGKGHRWRTGVYCSQVIGKKPDWESVVTSINLGHCGELAGELLELRDETLPPVLTMSDAASVNRPRSQKKTINGLCNVHGRRGFYYARDHFPEEAHHVLSLYQTIWRNDKQTKKLRMTPQERCAHHRQHSLPILKRIRAWCWSYRSSPTYEAHSALGKACRYFLKHFFGLALFCFVVGMPLDNNPSERGLKVPIRGRKLYHFFRTAQGARVASIHLTVLLTCIRSGINPKKYLLAVLRHQEAVVQNPSRWLPWNYQHELKRLSEESLADAA